MNLRMKKCDLFAFVALLPFCGSLHAQSLFSEKLDSIVSPIEKHAYDYDEKGNNTLHSCFVRQGGSWLLDAEYQYQYLGETVRSSYAKRYAPSGEMQWQYSEDLTTFAQGNHFVLTSPYYCYVTSMDNENRQLTSIMMDPVDNGEWKEVQKEIRRYDADGRTVLIETYRMQDDEWVGISHMQMHYNEEGLLAEVQTAEWQSGEWVTKDRLVSEYNADGQKTRYAIYVKKEGNMVLCDETETTYDGAFVKRKIRQLYDYVNGELVVANEFETLYDEHHNLELYESKQRFVNHYDHEGLLADVLCYVRQDGEWVQTDKAEFAYPEDGTTEMLVWQVEQDGLEATTAQHARLKLVMKQNEQGHIGKMWFYGYDRQDGSLQLAYECEPCYYEDALADQKLQLYWNLRSFLLTDESPSDLLGDSGKCVRYGKVDGVNRVIAYKENFREPNAYGGITTCKAHLVYDTMTASYKSLGYEGRKTLGKNVRMEVMTDIDETWDGETWVLKSALLTDECTQGYSPLRQTQKQIVDGEEMVDEYVFNYDFEADVNDICHGNALSELKCTSIDHYDGSGKCVDQTLYYYSPMGGAAAVASASADGDVPSYIYDVTGRSLSCMQKGINIVRKGNATRKVIGQ